MGAANVIPGVSGGTVAFITGIFETLINALKSFDVAALQLLTKGRFKEFWNHINGGFLLPLGLGVVISFVSLAKLLLYLFVKHPILIWAFFFGLILASVYYVGRTVSLWSLGSIVALIVGVGVAVFISQMKPAAESSSFIYLILCGVVGICSMIIPGLSGSFVIILMGNYLLILEAVNDVRSAATSLDFAAMAGPLRIFLPVLVGVVAGLILFSHFISWLFKRFHDTAIALLTGFVAGSLMIIWPWKKELIKLGVDGEPVLRSSGRPVVEGYSWHMPEMSSTTWFAIGLMVVGVILVVLMERLASKPELENGG